MDKGLSKLVEDGLDLSNRELSIFTIKKVGEKLELSIMGQKLLISSSLNQDPIIQDFLEKHENIGEHTKES